MLISFGLFLVVQIIVLIWVGVLTYLFFRAAQTYKQLTTDLDEKDVILLLKHLKKSQKSLRKNNDKLFQEIEAIRHKVEPHIQKLGFVRYNPFGNTGGDQSFCLCLLDERDNGILLTSLHARQQTRLYTKEIEAGKTKDGSQLSKEEQSCLKIAQKWSSS